MSATTTMMQTPAITMPGIIHFLPRAPFGRAVDASSGVLHCPHIGRCLDECVGMRFFAPQDGQQTITSGSRSIMLSFTANVANQPRGLFASAASAF
jgi:hypothetical protein